MTVCKVAPMGVLTPTSLDEALATLSEQPDALLLAGGTDLMVEINEGRHHVPDDESDHRRRSAAGAADAGSTIRSPGRCGSVPP